MFLPFQWIKSTFDIIQLFIFSKSQDREEWEMALILLNEMQMDQIQARDKKLWSFMDQILHFF